MGARGRDENEQPPILSATAAPSDGVPPRVASPGASRHSGSRTPPRQQGSSRASKDTDTDVAKLIEKAFAKELPALTSKVTNACTGTLQAICSEACQHTVQGLTGRLDALEEGQESLRKGQDRLSN